MKGPHRQEGERKKKLEENGREREMNNCEKSKKRNVPYISRHRRGVRKREMYGPFSRFLGHYTMPTFAIDAIFTPILPLLPCDYWLLVLLILLLIFAPIAIAPH